MDGLIALVILLLAGVAIVYAVRAHKRRRAEVEARQQSYGGTAADDDSDDHEAK